MNHSCLRDVRRGSPLGALRVPMCSCDCARLQASSSPWDPALSVARQVGHAAWLLHNCVLSYGGELACLLLNTKQVQPLALCPFGSSCHLWGLKTEAHAACCVLSHKPSFSNPLSLKVDSTCGPGTGVLLPFSMSEVLLWLMTWMNFRSVLLSREKVSPRRHQKAWHHVYKTSKIGYTYLRPKNTPTDIV